MAKLRKSGIRGSSVPLLLMGVTAFGFLGLIGLGIAWASGYFDGSPGKKPVDRTGQLAFPALVRAVPAFESLTKDDFIDPRTGQLHVIWLPEATATIATRDMSELIGRVVRRDKLMNSVLSENDFLEKGTRPGLSAGVPVGKVALSMPAAGIPGLEQLRNRDRFDLMIALPQREDNDQISNSEPAALFGGVKAPSLRVGQLSRQHGVKQLVTDGMLVTLYKGEKRSTTGSRGLTIPANKSKKTPSSSSGVFAELAIDAEEIGPLTEALSLGTKMICVVRSGQPTEAVADKFSIEGLVPVITTARTVSAFSQLSDENLIDESTGQLHLYYFPAENIADSWITDPVELYGRVVARNLRRGAFLTEADLLPAGTRPGISAGLPIGMSALSIDKTHVKGFEKLAVGDHFSILTRIPDAVIGGAPATTWGTLQGGRMSEDDARVAGMLRTGIREIEHDAIYLSNPDAATAVIGIPEQTVPSLAQLLRDESDVFVVANSSRGEPNQSDADSTLHRANVVDLVNDPKRDTDSLVTRRGSERHGSIALLSGQFPMPEDSSTNGLTARFVSQVDATNDLKQSDEVAVPILAQEVPAFSDLQVEDLIDPATGRVRMLFFSRDAVHDDWILDPKELIDRVARRKLRVGRPIRSGDLSPIGTPSGASAGLPAGMRGVTVNSRQVIGLETVSPGITFDLIAAKGVEVASLAGSVRQSLASSDAVREATKLPSGRVSASRTVSTGAMLLTDLGAATIVVEEGGAVAERQSNTVLNPDGSTETETLKFEPSTKSELDVQQFVLAVPESQVGSLLGMLDIQNPLFVSLRPALVEPTTELPSGAQPLNAAPVRAVIQEHVRGNEISSEVFLTDRVELGEGIDG